MRQFSIVTTLLKDLVVNKSHNNNKPQRFSKQQTLPTLTATSCAFACLKNHCSKSITVSLSWLRPSWPISCLMSPFTIRAVKTNSEGEHCICKASSRHFLETTCPWLMKSCKSLATVCIKLPWKRRWRLVWECWPYRTIRPTLERTNSNQISLCSLTEYSHLERSTQPSQVSSNDKKWKPSLNN